MIKELPAWKTLTKMSQPKKKRKVIYDSDDEVNDSNFMQSTNFKDPKNYNDDNDSNYSQDFVEQNFQIGSIKPDTGHDAKRTKRVHYTPEIIVEITDSSGDIVPIKALLDSGTTATLLLRKFVAPGRAQGYKRKPTEWKTMGGVFTTRRKALIDFKLPEFNAHKTVHWKCHVDDKTDPTIAQYDMIIGTDLMVELGIDINFSDKTIVWEDDETPLRPRGTLQIPENMEAIHHHLEMDPDGLYYFETHFTKILDADYSAVDMNEYVDTLDHISQEQREQLKNVLAKYPTLTKGGLGKLNIPPVHLELRADAKPYHARAFPIPKYYYETTRKEIQRFCKIGMMEKNPDSESGAPSFIRPKKRQVMCAS